MCHYNASITWAVFLPTNLLGIVFIFAHFLQEEKEGRKMASRRHIILQHITHVKHVPVVLALSKLLWFVCCLLWGLFFHVVHKDKQKDHVCELILSLHYSIPNALNYLTSQPPIFRFSFLFCLNLIPCLPIHTAYLIIYVILPFSS